MEGEGESPIQIELPKDVSDEFYEIVKDCDVGDIEEISNYFKELLSLERAACMVEIHGPIEVAHKAEYLLRENGYHVYSSMYFGLDFDDGFKAQTPGNPEPMISMYISLHEAFIEVAYLIEGMRWSIDLRDALYGLLFGYSVKNIIGYLEQPDKSPEDLKEYWNSLPP